MKTFIKPIVVALALTFTATSHGNSMQQVFDSINANANVTSPGVLQGQTQNAFTGGSLFMRAPGRTYQLVTATPPSWAAGCGGIDLFAGGFSFINKDQFVAMLKNIGSNAIGYAFKLALLNLCPTCDNVMTALNTTANAINRLNMDSCQAAVGVVNASVPDTWDRGRQQSSINAGTFTNIYSDVTNAWTNVMNNEKKTNETNKQVTAANPQLKEKITNGNITWKALKRANSKHGFGASDEDMMIWMSIIGTVIFDAYATDPTKPTEVTGTGLSIRQLVATDFNAAGAALEKTKIKIYQCQDGTGEDQCLKMKTGEVDIISFKGQVIKKMEMMMEAIRTRSPHPNQAELLKFVNATDLPVYKMIAVGTSLNNSNVAQATIGRYQDLIAAKYAEVWMMQVAKDLEDALSDFSLNAPPEARDTSKRLIDSLARIKTDVRSELNNAYVGASTTMQIAQELQHIERAMNASVSPMLKQSMNFARGIK
jgi:conjugative transfer pilus assembly protein TraH